MITHPQNITNAIPGKSIVFTVQATGTEPLRYQWQSKTGRENGGWQSCDFDRFPGANSSTLTIVNIQKSSEGSYRCVVSNIVGSQTSESVKLNIGKI